MRTSIKQSAEPSWRVALDDLIAGDATSYGKVYTVSPIDRIGIVKGRLPARLLVAVANDMRVPRERVYAWIGIARTTANRKVNSNEPLSQDESERALGIASLVGQVQKVVAESGEPEGFDAARWTADWLAEPNSALGGRPPGELLDTADGRSLVSNLVAQMQSGAYA